MYDNVEKLRYIYITEVRWYKATKFVIRPDIYCTPLFARYNRTRKLSRFTVVWHEMRSMWLDTGECRIVFQVNWVSYDCPLYKLPSLPVSVFAYISTKLHNLKSLFPVVTYSFVLLCFYKVDSRVIDTTRGASCLEMI